MQVWISQTYVPGPQFIKQVYERIYDVPFDETRLQIDTMGKRWDSLQEFYFNISHTKGYSVCVVSDKNVGVDIEVERVLKESLKKIIKPIPPYNLLDTWVILEAYCKYTGQGIKQILEGIDITTLDDSIILHVIHDFPFTMCIIGHEPNYTLNYL